MERISAQTGKQNALKAFTKIDPDDTLLAQMLHALEVQKDSREWLKDNGAFIPYPASWLNGRRWEDIEDEPPPIVRKFITKEIDGRLVDVEVKDD